MSEPINKERIINFCENSNNEQIRSRFTSIVNDLYSNHDDIVYIKMELVDLLSQLKEARKTSKNRLKYLNSKIKESPNPKDRLQSKKQKRAKGEIGLKTKKDTNLEYSIKYLELLLQEDNLDIFSQRKSVIKDESVEIPNIEIMAEIADEITPMFDPNKKVYSRKEACEYLQITSRKLTALLGGDIPKIKPISYANKPYTFNIEELERYRKEEM